LGLVASCGIAGLLALFAFYLSLVATSSPVDLGDRVKLDRAIYVLGAKGFDREAFLLRNVVTFRSSDNWLNAVTKQDNAYAATNFPFQIITLYPDFFGKTTDETERAMVLLHEAQHLQGADEAGAYSYVWKHREQLGWTQLKYGTTPTYINIGETTRDYSPDLFTCPDKAWNDCTETLTARK